MGLYIEASDAAATLAVATDPKKWQNAKLRFQILYNGPLSVVEDKNIDKAMVEFNKTLIEFEEKKTSKSREKLRKKSLSLAHSFKESIANDWRTKLRNMKGTYNKRY